MEKPLPIIVELWNSRGHDQTMPAADKLLKLRVSYSSEKISRQGYLVPSGEWSPVPARGAVSWKELPARFLASLTINKSRPAVFAPLAKALDHADPVVRRQAVTSIRRAKRSFQA
jgi:hypothetical protein